MSDKMRLVFISFCAVTVMFSGCSRKDRRTGAGGSDRISDVLIGDYALPTENFESLPRMDVHFSPIYFAYDSFRINPAEVNKMEQIAAFMRSNPSARLVTEGHCDERGTKEYNLALGENRALAVRAYLIQLGVSPDTVQTKSYGEEMPANPGHNESAWRLNRRVEFAFYRK